MKKFNWLILGLAGIAFSSCSQEDFVNNPVGDGYRFTVSLPSDMTTRASSLGDDASVAQVLNYAVYDNKGNLVDNGTKSFGGATETTVSLPLLKGTSYTIAFFAQSEASLGAYTSTETNPYIPGSDAVYNFDAVSKTMTVAYENMVAASNNQDAYDCFYKLHSTGVVGESVDTDVELVRPVAQINWGTSDLGTNAVKTQFGEDLSDLNTTLTVSAVQNVLNIYTGELTGTASNATIGAFTLPSSTDNTYPGPTTGYEYLAMQYVLADASSTIHDLTLAVTNGEDNANPINIDVTSAPLQANYRTNIYGTLLTEDQNFNVELSDDWGNPSNEIDLSTWDGSTSTTPSIVGNNVFVRRASDIAGLAEMVSGGNSLEGKTVVICSDFDMGGKEFPGIGSDDNYFDGILDGQGHTIANLYIDGNDDNSSFINTVGSGGVMNITFSNLTIVNGENYTGLIGKIDGGEVKDVTVSGTITGAQYTAGIAGRILNNGSVEGCTNNASVNGTKYVGGIVGYALGESEPYEMLVSQCVNTGNITATGDDAKYVGGVIGMSSAEVTGCSNSGSITNILNSTGGIVGEQRNSGKVTGCTNTGEVTETGTTNAAWGAGGIVGYVRYYDTNFPQSPIEISNNTNYASVSGYVGVGGIAGVWYYGGECSDNNNFAPSIVAASQFVAGIIGDFQLNGNQPTFGVDYKLTISGNKTSTTAENIKGNLSSLICFDNGNTSMVVYRNNQTDVPQEYPNK